MELMVLYADFNCPYSYALCEHLGAIGARVEWRGVEHAPGLSIPAGPPPDNAQFVHELAEVRALAGEVPLRPPTVLPNSGRALAAADNAEALDPERAADFRALVFRALWVGGLDISDPAVLREIANRAHLPEAVADGPGRVAHAQSPVGGIPALVRHNGSVLKGLVRRERLTRFLASSTKGDVQGAW